MARKQALDRLNKKAEALEKIGVTIEQSQLDNYRQKIEKANSQELLEQKYENEFLHKISSQRQMEPRIQQNK